MAAALLPAPVLAAERAVGPGGGFVVAPGARAVVMGSASTGLEAWAYPLQLFSGWRVRFRTPDRVAPLEGEPLLARVEADGAEAVRVYVGPDFTVRERLFTPADEPGAVVTYEVEGRPDVRIEARFQPSLDLMWPGALGGQSVGWDAARNGYVEREPLHGFTAILRSPEAVAHDGVENAASGRDGLALVLAPRPAGGVVRRARVFVAEGDAAGAAAVSSRLETQLDALRAAARARHGAALAQSVRITTPDPAVNRALADAETALDQAWVCAPDLGCGEVAGYGPSRPGRRPQYAWYFAGDGLVAAEGLIATGRTARARDELAFVARYQDTATGQVWHELSLSAPLIDWARRYPYMFVHVDITYQYLATLADYLRATDDRAFVAAHWAGIEQAWRYGRSLLDPATGLPAIPAGKQGQNEQAQLRDDVRLSSAWLDAVDGFARLAHAVGRPRLAAQAEVAAARTRRALAEGAWDAGRGFWIGGHAADGAPVRDERSDAVHLLAQGIFAPTQVDAALARLATPDFLTDWGVRSLSAASPDYDPNAYSQGAVWALGTSASASAFWAAHRPLAAWQAWRGLVAWNGLDSPGHLHEVLAGDLFHPERESVPAQTWSSAGLLTSAVHGLLGLDADAAARRLAFTPRLPATWDVVSVERLRVGPSTLALRLTQDAATTTLVATVDGPPVALDFAPALPLGADLVGAEVDGRPATAALEADAREPRARLRLTLGPGTTRVTVRSRGGVRLAPPTDAPAPGDASRTLKVADADWRDGVLTLHAFVADPQRAAVELITPLHAAGVEGGRLEPTPRGYRLTPTATAAAGAGGYAPALARVRFDPPAVQ